MIVRRRSWLVGLAAASVACKRKNAPTLTEVWDEEPAVAQAEAIGALAPPWPAPSRGQLDNGVITFWLHEADGVAMHVRLLIPIGAHAEPPGGEAVAVVAEHLRFDWQRRLQRLGVGIAVEHGPHRVELVASGIDRHLAATLAALRATLSSPNPAGLEGARDRVRETAPPRSSLELAASATVRKLEGIDEGVDVARLADATRTALAGHWQQLTDPRRCVLLVHSGTQAEGHKGELRKLSETWRGTDGRGAADAFVDQATGRLRPRVVAPSTGTRLLSSPPTPMIVAPGGTGGASLALGRTIPLTSASDRAMARLAQRVAQEEFAATVAICGDRALWLVTTGIGRSDADREIQRAVDELAAFARTRHPRQRLFGAVQLWLGARVVEASLDGEDWTRLFSGAIDLAQGDGAIAGALAKDAAGQLAVAPDALEAWTRKWLDPRGGDPGWAWAVAGVDPATTKRVLRVAPLA